MAITTIRSTYALDVATVRALEDLASRWGVSKSEVLRRAVRGAAESEPPTGPDALAALDKLQDSLSLTPSKAMAWTRRARTERRAASGRSESRGA